MKAYRVEESLQIDGRLDEDAWAAHESASGFVAREPIEGEPARNDSEVWILYDDEALYVGAVLHDETPAKIMRNMARRDAIALGQSDYFEVMLDPNRDGRTGYRFRATASNVQTDRYLFDDSKEDATWNAVWASGVQLDERGWTVEMRIPLSQLRYDTSDEPQSWGINFGRRRIADNELTRFSLESKLVAGRVSQFGLLEGILLDGSPRRIEFRPYVVSTARAGPAEDGNPFFDGSDVSGRVGVDLRYGLGSAFTLDATINPDFGQVEADPAVVNLTAFETFFQERRPFFVEDARIFDFALSGRTNRLFHSRRIGRAPTGGAPDGAQYTDIPDASSIQAATKLTGRTQGGVSVGAMWALTARERGSAYFDSSGEISRFTVEPEANYGVLRIEQDLRGGATSLGGIVTTMRRSLPSDGSFNDLTSSAWSGGIDFEHNWSNRRYAVWGFFSGSRVSGDPSAITRIQRSSIHYKQRPDLEWGVLDTTATRLTGAEWRLQVEKRRGRWQAAIWAAERTPDFAINDLGFSTASERLDGGASVQYQEVVPKSIFRAYTLRLWAFSNFSHEVLNDPWSLAKWDWAQTAGSVTANANLTFRNFWNLTTNLTYRPDRMSRTLTRGGPRMVAPGARILTVSFRNDNRGVVWLRPRVTIAEGNDGSGSQTRITTAVSLQPSARLRLSLDPTFDRQTQNVQYVASTGTLAYGPTYGRRYIFADLELRTVSIVARANYTFTPRLTLDVYAQGLLSSGNYLTYKQLTAPESFSFDAFEDGTYSETGGVVSCTGGRSCEAPSNVRYIDFDGNGTIDYSFPDRDFGVQSFRATAVLRWEYRPGSTLFLVWQRRQAGRSRIGDFDFGRDFDSMWAAPADDRFVVKMNLWLAW
jgi:Domain of unknown function (DUF5916)/Carbohydrate family 9 binding domain-like